MKTSNQSLLLLAMAWVVAMSGEQNSQRWSRELPSTHPNAPQLHERLQTIIIPRVDFAGTSVTDAINSVVDLARDGGRGMSTVVAAKGNEPTITLHGKAMRVLDVIDSICKQAGLFWWIDSTRLVISSKEAYARSVGQPLRK